MAQEQTGAQTGIGWSHRRRDGPAPGAARPVHVVTLLTAMPLIGALAALTVWWLGGTGWQIALSVLAAWLLIQIFYAAQLAFHATRNAPGPAETPTPPRTEVRPEIEHEGPARNPR